MVPPIPKLSTQEINHLLNSKYVIARLATASADGKPHVVPVWFLHSGNKFYVPTPLATLKARNISKTQYASLTIDSFEGVLNAKGLMAGGKARILKGRRSTIINLRIHRKYVGSSRLRRRCWKEFAAEDDATIVIEPKKWRNWDFSRLRL